MIVNRRGKMAQILPINALSGTGPVGPLAAKAREIHARAMHLRRGAAANASLRRFTAGASGTADRRRLFREAIAIETEATELAATIERKGMRR